MRATLDGNDLPGTIGTLRQAIASARDAAAARGRVVVEARADGELIGDDVLEDPSRAPATIGVVEFLSANPRAMVREALLGAAEALERARHDQGEVVASLDGGEIDAARSGLEPILGAWGACVATVRDGAALVGRDLSRPVNGEAPERAVGALIETLTEVKRAFGAEDWAGLSDAVGEDLERHAAAWDAMLRGLAEELSEPRG